MTTEPYPEPNPETNDYPEEWTPKQRTNWDDHAQDVYEQLETENGRYWYRRTWRPKMRGDGMMKRDHVKLGTPEDFVQYMVDDRLDMWADLTGAMMREIGRYDNKDALEDAVDDIVQARVSLMSDERKRQLAQDATDVAKLYGL